MVQWFQADLYPNMEPMTSIVSSVHSMLMALLQQWVRQRPWLAAGLAGLVGGVGGLAGHFVNAFSSSATISTNIGEGEDHPLRSSILQTLGEQPGLCYRELQRALQAANGSLRHHLDVLQVQRSITVVRVNGRTCYFAGEPNQVEVLSDLDVDPQRAARRLDVGLSVVQRTIVDHIREFGVPRSQAALSREIARPKATVHSAVKVLRRRGILRLDCLDLEKHLKESSPVRKIDYEWDEER